MSARLATIIVASCADTLCGTCHPNAVASSRSFKCGQPGTWHRIVTQLQNTYPHYCTLQTPPRHTHRQLNNYNVEILLDSGASCSVAGRDYVSPSKLEPMGLVRAVNADGRGLTSEVGSDYRIVGNIGRHKIWQICHERHLARFKFGRFRVPDR